MINYTSTNEIITKKNHITEWKHFLNHWPFVRGIYRGGGVMAHDDVIIWKHFPALALLWLAFCAGNSPVTGEFPAQRPVMRSFHVFFDLLLNKRLSKQSWGWWFETPSRSSWRHCNEMRSFDVCFVDSLNRLMKNNRVANYFRCPNARHYNVEFRDCLISFYRICFVEKYW